LAEDLGVVLKETDQILNDYNIPGMKVLQQRIPNNDEHNEVHPKHWKENVVAYTGTHDSPTVKQWLSESEEQQIMFYKNYLNNLNISNESDVWNFIELTWRTPSIIAVTNVQDILELDIEARFNLPGTQKDNWKWRVESLDALQEGLNKLKKLNEDTYRLNTLT
jgi:4-alpha-glucanotransferase